MFFTRKESSKDDTAYGDSWPAEFKVSTGYERVAIDGRVSDFLKCLRLTYIH
jgi:hypothetical protein